MKSTALAIVLAALSLPSITFGKPETPAKNIILMIGDGMGPQQISLAKLYANHAQNSVVKNKKLNLEELMNIGEVGIVNVEPYGNIVVDSAASASQFATGKPALSETIGLDEKGNVAETILERAKSLGKSVGLVSDTRLTHATPAAFVSHVAHRSMENEIAVQIVTSKADVLLSGGLRHFIPKAQSGSKRKDDRNLLDEAKKRGFAIITDRKSLKASHENRLLGLFTMSGMPDGIQHKLTKSSSTRTIPTLQEMTEKALEVLSKNPKGFFLMIEAGQIDWAGHRNDAATMLHEMLKFDEAIGYVKDWVKKRQDTIIIITADHETGSFGFSYSAINLPNPKKITGSAFKNTPFKPNFNFAKLDVLDKLYSAKMSQANIFKAFGKLKKPQQTAEKLKDLIKENLDFSISVEQAKQLITPAENVFLTKGHPYLKATHTIKIHDFAEFYGLLPNNSSALLGRFLGPKQNVVWGTGTHTSTPVTITAFGPGQKKFDGYQHSTDVGNKMFDIFRSR